jgi:hypothetical protein
MAVCGKNENWCALLVTLRDHIQEMREALCSLDSAFLAKIRSVA